MIARQGNLVRKKRWEEERGIPAHESSPEEIPSSPLSRGGRRGILGRRIKPQTTAVKDRRFMMEL
jgi:hypothetical protein